MSLTERRSLRACLQAYADAIGGELRSDGIHWQCQEHSVGSHTCVAVAPFSLRISCARLTPWDRAWLTWLVFPGSGGRA
jgi:hypothetical protein